ncbi:hypothetical protein AMS68_002692 [Peltaster fructicola]|uniref:Retinol dehydrogenase 12 n=1 Tax=Peltaster fructicola TaxID=286661 RepID=A0A6H0XRB7_9PEZI|nr:hypothetical protein AMS68_002692 [Peltaster fructicola]
MSNIIENVKTTLSQNLGGVAHDTIAPAETRFDLEKDVPDQSGKVAVLTGSTTGIGYGASHTLLKKNISKLFMISDGKDNAQDAIKAIGEEMGEDKAKRVIWIQADLGDWQRMTEVAKEIRDQTDRLDILVNNAARGIMTAQLTDYGVDRHMAVNHVGHVVLTSHLLPLLKKTASEGHTVRISNQASNAHQQVSSDLKFKTLEDWNRDDGPMGQYGKSKLAAILYSRYLARHLTKSHPRILINATHPGIVDTKMSTDEIHEPYPLAGYGMSVLLQPFKKTQFEGCCPTVYAVTVTEKSGQYICPPAAPEAGSDLAQNEELQEDLMELTRRVVTQKFGAQSVDKGCPMKEY